MMDRIRRKIPRARAIRFEPPSVAQGGLAFIIAYTLAYFVQGMLAL